MLTWVGVVGHAEAQSFSLDDSAGPWGLGGSYFFGFLAGFAIFGLGAAWRARKAHLAETQQ